jgi:hypothetical protein
VAGTLPAGWSLSIDPPRVILAPGANVTANVTILAPTNATVGASLPVVLVTRPTLLDASAGEARAGLVLSVANDFALDATLPDPLVAAPRASGGETIEVTSDAAASMRVALRASSAPTGWTVALRGLPLDLAPGDHAAVPVSYSVGGGAPPGDGNISLTMLLSDDVSPPTVISWSIPATTSVSSVLRYEGLPSSVVVPSGRDARFAFQAIDDGNAPVGDAPSVSGPGDVAWTTPPPWNPGQVVSAVLTLNASANATLAIGSAKLDVRVTPRALVLSDVRFAAPGAIAVTLENPSDIAAPPSRVEIADTAGLVLARADVPEIAPRSNLTRVLLVPASTGPLTVALDDGAAIKVEPPAEPAASNEGAASSSAAQRLVPAPPIALALAAALLMRRRRNA